MKDLKRNKGITLVALIITIIILLILAVVAIRAVQGDGIIQYAKNAKSEYELAQENEQILLNEYMNYLKDENSSEDTGKEDNSTGGDAGTTLTVAEAQTKGVLSTRANTDVYDEYGNKIVVPAGFKITTDASYVTEGIVIEDVSAGTETVGSQFVWIPVGDVYTTTDTSKTEANTKTITLGRYEFNSSGVASAYSGSYTENTSSLYGEAIAKDINGFISSATTKGGYYLGRYEARTTSTTARASGDSLTTATCIKINAVYNYITQPQASAQSQTMYAENNNYTSDLVNSYAWDTAIIFIQTFSGDSDYSMQTSLNTTLSTIGTENDKACNIYDMASNCYEWSTETSNDSSDECVRRGGSSIDSYSSASFRLCLTDTDSSALISFRPLIYLGL